MNSHNLKMRVSFTKLDANNPMEWVNSMVIVPNPDGSVRLMMDPRDLNKYMKRPHHTV